MRSSPCTPCSSAFESVGAVVGCTRRGRVLLLHFGKKRLNARSTGDRIVFLELDLGRNAKLELPRDARAEMRGNALESVERRLLFGITTQHADIDTGVPEIRAHFGSRHSDEADDARVLGRFGEEGRNLDADRFGDAVRSTRITQKRPPPK
jgi:hypothetical protein